MRPSSPEFHREDLRPLILLSQKVAGPGRRGINWPGRFEVGEPGGRTMNLGSQENSGGRFSAYVEGLASVLGHADRSGPLRDYCTGLMLPGERKSVEPMAAKRATPAFRDGCTTPVFVAFCRHRALVGRKVLAKVRELVLPAIEKHGPIEEPGSSTTLVSHPSRASIRWACIISIVGNMASVMPIVGWRCRCRLPTARPACRWRIGCICRRTGSWMMRVGRRPACLWTSASRPSLRSRLSRYGGGARPTFRAGSF